MALLEVSGLTRDFGGLRAVADLSFIVAPGEILGLIGPNGAGKTTVFNLISGALKPTAGRILLQDADVTGLPAHARARLGIARTFQIVRPFRKLTVKENVTLAAFLHHPGRHAAEVEALRLLGRVGLEDKTQRLAADLTLSEQRRLELGRALALRPKLLLLDEPLGGLNPAEVEQAAALVRALCAEGITIVLIEHVMRAIMGLSHRVVVIHHGKKIAEGAPAAVARDPKVLSAYLGKQAV